MPALIPLAAALAVTALTASQIAGAVAAVAASTAIAARDRRRAERAERAAYNASLRDQLVSVKGGVNPRPIIYGRAAVGGQLIYAETTGARKEVLLMVFAFAHGEVDAIETVYFNEQALTLSGNAVTDAPYAVDVPQEYFESLTVPGSPFQVTLTETPNASPPRLQDVTYGTGGGDAGAPQLLLPGTDYTIAGAVVTFGAHLAGRLVQIQYAKDVATSHAYIWKFTGAPGQDLSPTMMALGAPSWTSADKCQGMAALVVKLVYGENRFPAGIPNVKAVIRGRKVYDPRTGLTGWSRNATLCSRDYLTLQYGVGAAAGKINDDVTIASANICDEDVQVTAGPEFQDRYTVDGAISTADDRLSNLRLFAEAMAGSINYSAGQWRVRAGAYTAPTLTLTEGHLADGDIAILPYASRRDLLNGAKATFINAAAGFIEDQAPEWSSATFIADDGGRPATVALSLPLVTDSIRAQRLSKIAVYRTREQLTLRVNCNLKTYLWQVGDMVSVSLARYGFSAKPFRIVDRGFNAEGGMRFELREEPNGIYDWNLGEASVLTGAGNTVLPNPAVVGMPTITGITSAQWLYKAGDGTFVARIRVAVTPPADEYVRRGGKLQLQYKRGDWSGDWVLLEADGDASAIWIDPAFDAQNYLIRVRAKNSANYVSAWTDAQVHTCSGRPGQVVNLLQNSDFTENLGFGSAYFPDARALRSWLLSYNTGGEVNIGRNYDGGRTWNIGAGGAWTYTTAPQPGHYFAIVQRVPVAVGVAYEASVYTSTHRCQAHLYLRWLNASSTFISDAMGGADFVDNVPGNPFDPVGGQPRLWRSGVAPAGAAFAEIILLKTTTNPSETQSYAFWNKVLLCVAPTGVTKVTATPWVQEPAQAVSWPGIVVAAATGVTTVAPTDGYTEVNGSSNQHFFTGIQYTNETDGTVSCVVSIAGQFRRQQVSGTQQGANYGYSLIGNVGGNKSSGSALFDLMVEAADNAWASWAHQVIVTMAPGETLTLAHWVNVWGTAVERVHWRGLQAQMQVIKR